MLITQGNLPYPDRLSRLGPVPGPSQNSNQTVKALFFWVFLSHLDFGRTIRPPPPLPQHRSHSIRLPRRPRLRRTMATLRRWPTN